MTEKQTHHRITLIEMLMIVSLIAVVISLAIVFFDPIGRSAVSRNAERWNHVNTIASALYEYAQDHDGNLPSGIDARVREMCAQSQTLSRCEGEAVIDLSVLTPSYIKEIPTDKSSGKDGGSGYTVQFLPPGRLYVVAIYPENGDTIGISR